MVGNMHAAQRKKLRNIFSTTLMLLLGNMRVYIMYARLMVAILLYSALKIE